MARSARQATHLLAAVAGLLLLGMPCMGIAQTMATPEEEYKKLIKVNEDVQPLGETPFGERISLYDGSLSFSQTDVTVTGTGPTITVGREFALHGREDRPDLQQRAFGDWDMTLPQIFTVTANQRNVTGWQVASSNQKAICTQFREPPSVAAPPGDALRADWEPETWWQGYQLRIPGQGSQDLLRRSTANTVTPGVGGLVYPIVTKGNWAVGCLAQASNDPTLEGFLAVAPDGTKYWLDHIAYRYMAALRRPLGSSPLARSAQAGSVFKPQASGDDFVIRREGRMLVSRVEDRFGNWVTYGYSGDDVVDITASDGRHVTIAYQADPSTGASTHRVATVSVQGGASGTRTWTYGYVKSAQNLVYTLTSVVQPDGSSWGYNLDPLNHAFVDLEGTGGTCATIGTPVNMSQTVTATMSHPSGLSASVTVAPLKRGRSYVFQECRAGTNIPAIPNGPGTWAATPNASYGMAIVQRTLTGAGLPSGGQVWNYSYSPSNESWSSDCTSAACPTTIYTDVAYPDGHTERSTFSNRYDWTESQLVQEDVFDGNASTARRRSTIYSYVNPAAQGTAGADARSTAYVHPWGYAPQTRINSVQFEEQAPMASRQVILDPAASATPDTFTWSVGAFDAFARARDVTRASSFGFSVSERSTFVDNTALWAIGLPAQSINLTRNEMVTQTDYDAATATPTARYHLGLKVMDYTFNPQGQLASFTDPLAHTTTLSSYVLGIPTSITYPDKTPDHPNGTTQTLVVDGFGQIASITDQAGATTAYGYDAIGRLTQINYPGNDSVAWAPRILSYTYSADARGMGGNHWVRSVTQGTYAERTDFDAMLRPVMTGKAEAGTGALYVSTRTEYDWAGRKLFESYPVDGAPDRGGIVNGVSTAYDALGRATSKTQTAEQAGVTTTTGYLAGGIVRVTDPNGNVVDTANQAFDEPVYDKPVSVATSDGTTAVVQTIARNVYGNPEVITQGAVVRKIYYDPQQRVCRTFDPETKSEMTAYDAAGNAAWTASGQAVDGDSFACGYDQVASGAKTNRTYDGMNRPATITYPGGTVGVAFTYDPLGNPATAVSTTATASPNTTGTVNWSFGRNKRGLLTAEVLSTGTLSWGIGYGYDANGNLASTQYPDGKVVAASPNALGQPTAASTYATAAAYHPDGQLKSFAFGNGALYSATLNDRNLLGNFTVGTAASMAISEDFAYDKNANITTIHDLIGSGQRTRTMTYDGMNRLTSATASGLWGAESYTYDAANNIRSITNSSGTSTYNYGATNLLESITGANAHTFLYDPQGNTTRRDSQAMVFDLANRLLSVTGKGDYLYDSAGRRVRSVAPSGTTYYAYNAAGQLLWQFNPATNAGTDYVYLGKKLIASTNGAASTSTVPSLSAPSSALVNTAYTVAWTAVSGTTSYELQEKSGTGAWATIATGTAQNKAVTHTAAGTFSYQVRACVSGTCGAYSNQATTVVTASGGIPAAPSTVTATLSANEQSILVTWSASAGATSYTVLPQGSASGTQTVTGTNASYASPSDGGYAFGVQACNANGCSIAKTSSTLVLHHRPAAPQSISVPTTSTGVVAISWPAATYAASYEVEQSSDNIAFAKVSTVNGTSANVLVSVGGTYFFRVRGCNLGPCGGYSPVSASTVSIQPTSAPTISVPATSATGCYAVNWTKISGATSYLLQESVNGATFATIANDGSGNLSICGKANAKYTYRIQACNAAGCGPVSGVASVTVLLPPAVPTGAVITKTVLSSTNIRFVATWDAVATTTSYELTKDSVKVYSGTSRSNNLQQGASPTLTGTYAVRACNASGCSAYATFPSP